MKASAVPPNLTGDLEARIERQKTEIQSFQRDLQSTQDFRFKVSMLMTVLLHRHHPPAEFQNEQSLTYHQLVVTLTGFNLKIIQCRKQYRHWLQLRVRHKRASRQLQWQYTILLFRRLLYRLKLQLPQSQSLIKEGPTRERSATHFY